MNADELNESAPGKLNTQGISFYCSSFCQPEAVLITNYMLYIILRIYDRLARGVEEAPHSLPMRNSG
jgi:hypothetical protein